MADLIRGRLANDAHPPQATRQLKSLGDGRRRARQLYHDVRAFPAGQIVHERCQVRLHHIHGVIDSQLARPRQAHLFVAVDSGDDGPCRARGLRHLGRREADWPAAEDEYHVLRSMPVRSSTP